MKNKNNGPQLDQSALLGILSVQYRSMTLEKLSELSDNLTAQLTLINSIIEEKSPDQEAL